MPAPGYRFGPFFLDLAAYRLRQGAADVDLTPKAFAVLAALVERAPALVTKEELFARAWPDVTVTDNALTQVVSDLRLALNDSRETSTYVQTVARRGYRFVAPVSSEPLATSAPSATIPLAPTATSPPTVAVLDFRNITQDPELDWLSAGIAETVTGVLASTVAARVTDRSRLLALQHPNSAPLDIARAANATAVVSGGYQRVGQRLRLTARLIDVTSGEVRSEARADGTLDAIFELQDDVARQICAALGAARTQPGRRRARHTSHFEAYRAAVEGRLLLESLDPEALTAAMSRFLTAIQLDPGYAAAHVGLASARGSLFERTRYRFDPATDMLAAAIEDAQRGVSLDEGYAEAHATLSFLLVSAGRRDEARQAAQRAVTLDPGEWMHQFRLGHASWGTPRLAALARVLAEFPAFPYAYFQRAMVFIARGEMDEAESTLETGIRSEPSGPRRFPASGLRWLLGLVALARGDAEHAIGMFEAEQTAVPRTLYSAEFALGARIGVGFARLAMGDPAAAVSEFHEASADDASGRALAGLAFASRALNDDARAERARHGLHRLTEAVKRRGHGETAALLEAALLVARGETDAALTRLETALAAARPGPFGWLIGVDPAFAVLRDAPRMRAVADVLRSRAG